MWPAGHSLLTPDLESANPGAVQGADLAMTVQLFNSGRHPEFLIVWKNNKMLPCRKFCLLFSAMHSYTKATQVKALDLMAMRSHLQYFYPESPPA